jgi:hypothetical protein
LPLKAKLEFHAITVSQSNFEKPMIVSSAIPSAKYSYFVASNWFSKSKIAITRFLILRRLALSSEVLA